MSISIVSVPPILRLKSKCVMFMIVNWLPPPMTFLCIVEAFLKPPFLGVREPRGIESGKYITVCEQDSGVCKSQQEQSVHVIDRAYAAQTECQNGDKY